MISSIGSYHFQKFLSSGAYGGVWECVHIGSNKLYACKIIELSMCLNESFFEHFKNELLIHSKIRHPGITQLQDVLMDSKNIYIVIELCDGGDLNDAVQNNFGLTEDLARDYFFQIMGAISYIHRLDIAHRDIKLENILITSDNCAKLTDFGLCKQQNGSNLLLTTCGTLVYAAPEIIKEIPYDGRKADIWSAGILLYAMVANHFPWQTNEELPPDKLIQATAQQIVNGEIVFPDDISLELLNLLQNMLNVDPDERPTSEEILQHPWFEDKQASFESPLEPDERLIKTVYSVITELDRRVAKMKGK